MNEKICTVCGTAVESETAHFCPECGALLPVGPAKWDAGDLEDKLRRRYRAYNDWAVEFRNKDGGARRLLSLVTSSSPFKNSEEHGKFFEDVKARTEELLAAYREEPGSGNLPATLHFALIDCHGFACEEADWMFMAAEQLYMPMLELISGDESAALLAAYQKLRKKNNSFDFQRKIMKKLKSIGN